MSIRNPEFSLNTSGKNRYKELTLNINPNQNLGRMTIFGIMPQKAEDVAHRIQTRLGVVPQVFDLGRAGRLFFYTNQGELVQNSEMIALKIGHIRNLTYSPLSTEQLLTQKILSPERLDVDAFTGNALLLSLSLTKPAFLAYQTFMSLPTLFYTTNPDGSQIYATDFRTLLFFRDRIELDESIIPMFFLMRVVFGSHTYIRHVKRLFSGEILTWRGSQPQIRLVRPLSSHPSYHTIRRATPEATTHLYETMCAVLGAYLADFERQGLTAATLLSGGVDSSLIQIMLNQLTKRRPLSSFSYTVEAKSFQAEVQYAKEASRNLNTHHTFFTVTKEMYLDKINRVIEVLARPQLYVETTPCNFALSEYLGAETGTPDIYIAGQAADALNGLSDTRKYAVYDSARRFHGARLVFKLAGFLAGVIQPEDRARMIQDIALMLPTPSPTAAIYHPYNLVALLSDLELTLRIFGEAAILAVLEERYNLARRYLSSTNLLENIHVIDLLTTGYEPATISWQFYAANQRQTVQFYLDEEIIRAFHAFVPQIRFLKGRTTKPLLKQILNQQGFTQLASKRKKATVFNKDLLAWFANGPLAERVQAIKRPDFLSQHEFNNLLAQPSLFLWNLLTWDIFTTQVLPLLQKSDLPVQAKSLIGKEFNVTVK